MYILLKSHLWLLSYRLRSFNSQCRICHKPPHHLWVYRYHISRWEHEQLSYHLWCPWPLLIHAHCCPWILLQHIFRQAFCCIQVQKGLINRSNRGAKCLLTIESRIHGGILGKIPLYFWFSVFPSQTWFAHRILNELNFPFPLLRPHLW